METVDDEIRDMSLNFIDKAKKDDKPFFVWLNPTRMHIVTHLSPKYEAMRNSVNGWRIEEAGMAQLDDDIGLVMQKLKDIGETTTPSSFSPPITAPKRSPGPMEARRRSRSRKERSWKAASVCRDRSLARPYRGGFRAERHHVRLRLVADVRRRRRKPEHHR